MTKQNGGPALNGLSAEQAKELQAKFGKNELTPAKKKNIFREILKTLSEPMFILLLVAAVIYFILGEPRDGAIMLIFVIGIISIDVIQEWKTDKTLEALKDLSAPHIRVLRDGEEKTISSTDLVPGDLMLISEGVKIPADGEVIRASDLCVDESSLTGEAEGVWKVTADDAGSEQKNTWRRDCCYAGTLVTQGSATVRVEKIGAMTEYGKIGANVVNAPENPTPLQKQTGKLVKLSAGIAAVLFALVCCVTWLNIPDHLFKDRLIESILSGITLAMAMIPEEFPVILTVFLSLGAWRLAKKQSLVRKLPAVETLGAVSVLCVDKTGTITMNRMTVRETWAPDGDERNLCEVMGMGCETETYDPMEKAMLAHCDSLGLSRAELFSGELVREYPFTNEAKMMGHVWKRGDAVTVAAKGSPEKILKLCSLNAEEKKQTQERLTGMSRQGLRVIAVGRMQLSSSDSIPKTLSECVLRFCGLVGLADPPRESVKEDIRRHSGAVVLCIMDTSGSMDQTKKYLARSFYFMLYQFVRWKYQQVEVVFIAHTTTAKEVDEDEFFHRGESGGTYISSGYEKALELIEQRYNPAIWNVYVFHCSDGDNWNTDNEKAVELAQKLCMVSNLFGYGEISTSFAYDQELADDSTIWEEFQANIKCENFVMVTINKREDIWPAFKKLLEKESASGGER